MNKKLLAFVIVLVALVAVGAYNLFGTPASLHRVTSDEKPTAPAAEAVDVVDLAKDLASSENKATRKYKNATITFTGTFVEADELEHAFMVLCAITDDEKAQDILFNCCLLDEASRNRVSHFSTGDSVTVTGTVTEIHHNSYEISVQEING